MFDDVHVLKFTNSRLKLLGILCCGCSSPITGLVWLTGVPACGRTTIDLFIKAYKTSSCILLI